MVVMLICLCPQVFIGTLSSEERDLMCFVPANEALIMPNVLLAEIMTLNQTFQLVQAFPTGVSAIFALIWETMRKTNVVETSCVTSYEMFRNVLLDREVLTLAILARCDFRAEDAEYEMSSYRKAAYR